MALTKSQVENAMEQILVYGSVTVGEDTYTHQDLDKLRRLLRELDGREQAARGGSILDRAVVGGPGR